ncbi:type VII secretion protein EccCb [Mycolicibacterium frederiksbergense]|uniref:Type VII secretion protein EccCb n=1 Tax=Mycolicibacterium frederiksbergense TaxID=117567 RepID=A0A6H0RXD2_9MYCO|nr:type VII secretion protein EccCb [Mycolicibacterium frederiksbergense]QIV79932.1 type VII secretion protein EccCb [Mycolicibacterium frederiksbergense]
MVVVTRSMPTGLRFAAQPDIMPIYEAEALARALAGFTPTDEAESLLAKNAEEARAGQDFTDALGIYDLRTWNPTLNWNSLSPANRLRAPIGKAVDGRLVYLDMKEGAEDGVGPHGSMVGQTGSGKSEHLISTVLALCATHSPEQLRILLGDFKGESAFGPLEFLPHCDGIISNLSKSQHKLDRFKLVLRGELQRRQELLRRTGFANVRSYEKARTSGRTDLEPIPALLLVLDEFSQMLELVPEMAKVMDEVARLGRSLWIHILNASQRMEVGKMAGMIAQQTFAIGLKVKDAGESRAAIGSTRAWEELKNAPQGSAFLVVDGDHTRYRSFYASGQFIAPKMNATERDRTEGHYLPVTKFSSVLAPLPDTVVNESDLEHEEAVLALDTTPEPDAPAVAELMVERMTEAARTVPRGHRMWRPALDDTTALTLDVILGEYWNRPWDEFTEDSGLVAPYGREDDPFEHSQDVVALSLIDTNGGVAGAPQAGKSTALRTVIMSLAAANSPQRVQFYGIDFGGLKLQSVAGLPHVCGIAGTGDEEKIQRVVSEVERILRNRKRDWTRWVDPADGQQSGMDLSRFRDNKFGPTRRPVPEDGHGDVFLVVDNITAIKTELLAIHDRINALADGALNFGVHVLISNDSWMGMKAESKLGSKVELRLANNNDSLMDRAVAKTVPDDQKGRGVVKPGKHMLVAVPYVSKVAHVGGEVAATEATASLIAQKWAQRGFGPAPQLQQLPAEVAFTDLAPLPATAPRHALRIGIGERDMSTAWLDLELYPHAFCTGTTKAGRSVFLRTVCAAIMETYTPDQAQVMMFDPDFSIGDALADEYRTVWETDHTKIGTAATQIAQLLEQRRPPEGLDPRQLRNWKPVRPKWFILVDDLTALSPNGPTTTVLQPLMPAVEAARNLDVHVIASVTSEGWYARGGSNKLIQAMQRGGTSVLVLDGDRKEVIIDQVRPAARIPGRGELYLRKAGGQLIQVALPPAVD